MKKFIYTIFVVALISLIPVVGLGQIKGGPSGGAKDPSDPNGGGPSGNPVGGGAPIGTGMAILLSLGGAYTAKKTFFLAKNKQQ